MVPWKNTFVLGMKGIVFLLLYQDSDIRMAKKKNKKKGKYDATLNLFQTEFTWKPSIREPEMVKYWEELTSTSRFKIKTRARINCPHDGPPFANGTLPGPYLKQGTERYYYQIQIDACLMLPMYRAGYA